MRFLTTLRIIFWKTMQATLPEAMLGSQAN